MPEERSLAKVIRKSLKYGDLQFRDFVELALYHPELGYYSGSQPRAGVGGDFITAPLLSPAFSFAISNLVREFMSRGTDDLYEIVDIGCGDGTLIHSLYEACPPDARDRADFMGVDRFLLRVSPGFRDHPGLTFTTSLPPSNAARLIISNELFDAFPFARVVQRGEHLNELWVTERDGELDWIEQEAGGRYEDYFAERGIELIDGQFADVSLDWNDRYDDICASVRNSLLVTFDYGLTEEKLFRSRLRRFGTAAAYSKHRVSRDLLANPGQQDLTAHINFSDLQRAGERRGFATLFFDTQAKFLLSLGITDHELFAPVTELETDSAEQALEVMDRRDRARRLVLPDGIGEEIRVLVQARGFPPEGWSFQRKLF